MSWVQGAQKAGRNQLSCLHRQRVKVVSGVWCEENGQPIVKEGSRTCAGFGDTLSGWGGSLLGWERLCHAYEKNDSSLSWSSLSQLPSDLHLLESDSKSEHKLGELYLSLIKHSFISFTHIWGGGLGVQAFCQPQSQERITLRRIAMGWGVQKSTVYGYMNPPYAIGQQRNEWAQQRCYGSYKGWPNAGEQ